MRRLSAVSQIACLLLLQAAAPCQTTGNNQVVQRLHAYLRPFAETGNFTGAVLVASHGRVLLRQSYGMANYELNVPNSVETRFHVASVSKPFTAAAILQLQEQGRVHLPDQVSRYIPDFPNGDRITLDQLLTHTSGIPDINDLPDYDAFARSPHSIAQLVARVADLPLDFQPGATQEYSNSNYNLLALVLEKVAGESYEAYLRGHIFGPAGMRNSGHDGDASHLIRFQASGYQPDGITGYGKAPYVDWSNKTGNGSLYSTVDDLYSFDRALKTDVVLKSATREKYFVEGEGNRYGWYIGKRLGHRMMAGKGRSLGLRLNWIDIPTMTLPSYCSATVIPAFRKTRSPRDLPQSSWVGRRRRRQPCDPPRSPKRHSHHMLGAISMDPTISSQTQSSPWLLKPAICYCNLENFIRRWFRCRRVNSSNEDSSGMS